MRQIRKMYHFQIRKISLFQIRKCVVFKYEKFGLYIFLNLNVTYLNKRHPIQGIQGRQEGESKEYTKRKKFCNDHSVKIKLKIDKHLSSC